MVRQTSSSLLLPAKREEVDHRAAPIQRICKQTCSPTTTTQSAHYLPILSPAPDLIGRIICLSNLTSLHAVDDRKLVPITSGHDFTRPPPTPSTLLSRSPQPCVVWERHHRSIPPSKRGWYIVHRSGSRCFVNYASASPSLRSSRRSLNKLSRESPSAGTLSSSSA